MGDKEWSDCYLPDLSQWWGKAALAQLFPDYVHLLMQDANVKTENLTFRPERLYSYMLKWCKAVVEKSERFTMKRMLNLNQKSSIGRKEKPTRQAVENFFRDTKLSRKDLAISLAKKFATMKSPLSPAAFVLSFGGDDKIYESLLEIGWNGGLNDENMDFRVEQRIVAATILNSETWARYSINFERSAREIGEKTLTLWSLQTTADNTESILKEFGIDTKNPLTLSSKLSRFLRKRKHAVL